MLRRPAAAGRASGRRRRLAPPVVAIVMVVGAAVTVLGQSAFRPVEARFSAAVIGASHVAPARSMGNVIVFPMHDAFVGLALNAGCSASLLVTPFFLLAAALVLTRRTSIQRGLSTLAALVVALFLLNQVRLLVIAGSMRLWGSERGFEISHVVLGTVLSTLGVLVGLLLYLRTALHSPVPAEIRG